VWPSCTIVNCCSTIANILDGRLSWFCRTRYSSIFCSPISTITRISPRKRTTEERWYKTRPKRTAPRRKWATVRYRTEKGKAIRRERPRRKRDRNEMRPLPFHLHLNRSLYPVKLTDVISTGRNARTWDLNSKTSSTRPVLRDDLMFARITNASDYSVTRILKNYSNENDTLVACLFFYQHRAIKLVSMLENNNGNWTYQHISISSWLLYHLGDLEIWWNSTTSYCTFFHNDFNGAAIAQTTCYIDVMWS